MLDPSQGFRPPMYPYAAPHTAILPGFRAAFPAEPKQTLLWRVGMREECPAGTGQ
jgi:hypothetical protein